MPPVQIYKSGQRIPHYTLCKSEDLRVLSGSVTVDRAHTLSTLLQPNMGTCHWAACRGPKE